MQLSEKLVKLRKDKGLSQLKLAEMMDVSRQAISRWEVGAAVPSVDNLKYLGCLYDVPLEYLLDDAALEPIYTHMELACEDSKSVGRKKHRKMVFLFISIVILISIMFAVIFANKEEKPIPMGNIEGSDMETVSDFELDW